MRIEDVVEALNQSINDKRTALKIEGKSFLVLKKSITPDETFKAYKVFNYEIWCINGKSKYKIQGLQCKARAVTEDEINKYRECYEITLCRYMFNWKSSGFFDQVVNDKYEGVENETI